jgi:hypothetical protein
MKLKTIIASIIIFGTLLAVSPAEKARIEQVKQYMRATQSWHPQGHRNQGAGGPTTDWRPLTTHNGVRKPDRQEMDDLYFDDRNMYYKYADFAWIRMAFFPITYIVHWTGRQTMREYDKRANAESHLGENPLKYNHSRNPFSLVQYRQFEKSYRVLLLYFLLPLTLLIYLDIIFLTIKWSIVYIVRVITENPEAEW